MPMRTSFRVALASGALALTAACPPPTPPLVPRPLTALERRAVGCYELYVGPWRALATGALTPGRTTFSVPSNLIALDSLPPAARNHPMTLHAIRFPRGGSDAAQWMGTFWGPDSTGDSLRLDFSRGFWGTRLHMAVYADSLVGRATDWSDNGPSTEQAPAVAYRLPCQGQWSGEQPPNTRLKLSGRGGREAEDSSVLPVAAPARSLSAGR